MSIGDFDTRHGHSCRDAYYIIDGRVDTMAGNSRQTRKSLRMTGAEAREPFVIDPHHFDFGFGILQALSCAKNTLEDLRLNTVPVLVLHAKFRLGRPPDSIQTVFVKPLRHHHVEAMNLSRLIFTADRPHAVDETEIGAGAADLARSPFRYHVDIAFNSSSVRMYSR